MHERKQASPGTTTEIGYRGGWTRTADAVRDCMQTFRWTCAMRPRPCPSLPRCAQRWPCTARGPRQGQPYPKRTASRTCGADQGRSSCSPRRTSPGSPSPSSTRPRTAFDTVTSNGGCVHQASPHVLFATRAKGRIRVLADVGPMAYVDVCAGYGAAFKKATFWGPAGHKQAACFAQPKDRLGRSTTRREMRLGWMQPGGDPRPSVRTGPTRVWREPGVRNLHRAAHTQWAKPRRPDSPSCDAGSIGGSDPRPLVGPPPERALRVLPGEVKSCRRPRSPTGSLVLMGTLPGLM